MIPDVALMYAFTALFHETEHINDSISKTHVYYIIAFLNSSA
jgi:hypothetical protein